MTARIIQLLQLVTHREIRQMSGTKIFDEKVREKSGKFITNCQSHGKIKLFWKCLRECWHRKFYFHILSKNKSYQRYILLNCWQIGVGENQNFKIIFTLQFYIDVYVWAILVSCLPVRCRLLHALCILIEKINKPVHTQTPPSAMPWKGVYCSRLVYQRSVVCAQCFCQCITCCLLFA